MLLKQKESFFVDWYAKFDSLKLVKVALPDSLLSNKLTNYTDKTAKNKKRKSSK